MNILFGPQNIASMPAITTNSLNKINGVNARYLSTQNHIYLEENSFRIPIVFPFIYNSFKKSPLKNILFRLSYYFIFNPYKFYKIFRWILWADVIHWSWDSTSKLNLDLKLMKLLKKKRFIEWVGSDMRIPEITMRESKWYKQIFNNGYEYREMESKENSYKIQEKFAKYGFNPMLVPEMNLFLKPGLFENVFLTQYRVFQNEKFPEAFYPVPVKKKIIIVHSPSAIFAKGSGYIIDTVTELKKKYEIEFIMLHKVSRQVVLETMKSCDIFIDQIILGSYAAAAIEAMSWGKPTIAYIMPSVYRMGIPEDCPVVNANPDTLKDKLTELIENPQLRHDIGVKSREYAQHFHNADILAKELLQTYQSYVSKP